MTKIIGGMGGNVTVSLADYNTLYEKALTHAQGTYDCQLKEARMDGYMSVFVAWLRQDMLHALSSPARNLYKGMGVRSLSVDERTRMPTGTRMLGIDFDITVLEFQFTPSVARDTGFHVSIALYRVGETLADRVVGVDTGGTAENLIVAVTGTARNAVENYLAETAKDVSRKYPGKKKASKKKASRKRPPKKKARR